MAVKVDPKINDIRQNTPDQDIQSQNSKNNNAINSSS